MKVGIILFLSLQITWTVAQSSNKMNDELKLFIYTSIISDGPSASFSSWNEWVDLNKNHFDNLKIEQTSVIDLLKPKSQDSIEGKYSIVLYKILDINSKNISRYLIKYEDFSSKVWLRVGGYVENDLNLLFDYLKQGGLRKKDLRKVINSWKEADKIFQELNLTCLLKGYFRKKTSSYCFRTVKYVKENDLTIGYTPLKTKDLNSVFSRIPIYGVFHNPNY